jgi:hypothetical protein
MLEHTNNYFLWTIDFLAAILYYTVLNLDENAAGSESGGLARVGLLIAAATTRVVDSTASF